MAGDSSLSSTQQVMVEEWTGSSSSKLSMTATICFSPSISRRRFDSHFKSARRHMLSAFVPEGFPSSVTPDYAPFQLWDSLQGLSTYIRTMLSTQALLSAIGVGEKSATVIGATFQWFLRDFTGMLGGIMFTFYQGSNLDSNAKMWRLVADLMNDLDEGKLSGATRAALTQHFTLQDNAADISAKEGSQETVATMAGMAIGMFLARVTMGQSLAIWFSFLSLTIFHMYANYRAVRCLSLNTLNGERSSILLQNFMETGTVLSTQKVSSKEHVLPLWLNPWSSQSYKHLYKRIQLGVKVSSLNDADMMELFHCAGTHYKKAKYLLLQRKGTIRIVMHKDSTQADVLKSYVHALVMANLLHKSASVHIESLSWMSKHYDDFIRKLQLSGWKTERLLSHSVVWTANWFIGSSDEKIK